MQDCRGRDRDAIAWTKLLWITAYASTSSEDVRKEHCQNLVPVNCRTVLAGEH